MGDVRDFNWLKNGVPSPNFVVEEESEVSFDVEKSDDGSDQINANIHQADTVALQENCTESLPIAENPIQSTTNNQDDEDEL